MVEALAVNTALPALAHGEEKVTVCGVVIGTPELYTVTATLVVPNAEIDAKPNVGFDMVRLGATAAPTDRPIKAETVVPLT